MSPDRYRFSKTLLFPRNERIRRFTCPAFVRTDRPPFPSCPALLDIAVSECRFSGPLLLNAAINVSIPQSQPGFIMSS